MARAYVGVGSNLAPEKNVLGALELITLDSRVMLTGISTFYRTPALPRPGGPENSAGEDPDYLNGVLALQTPLSPGHLITLLEQVEHARGRIRTEDKHAPRTIDLDLLLYLVSQPEMKDGPEPGFRAVLPPHPEIRTRSFVAVPLWEVAPRLRLPPDGTSVQAIAKAFDGPGGVPESAFTERLRRKFLRT